MIHTCKIGVLVHTSKYDYGRIPGIQCAYIEKQCLYVNLIKIFVLYGREYWDDVNCLI